MSNDPACRFLEAMMSTISLPSDLMERPATTVIGRPDRADTGVAACYRVGSAAIIWTDPAVADRFEPLADSAGAVAEERFAAHALEVGLTHLADAAMRVLPSGAIDTPPTPDGYRHRRLTNDDVDQIRALTVHCTADEVEDAALDELDDFDELAINVLTADGSDDLVAFASAAPWDWDATFGDLGVLVHPDHRRRGLGQWVVAQATADLLEGGHLPLYRHRLANTGSAALADRLGFETVTWFQAYGLGS